MAIAFAGQGRPPKMSMSMVIYSNEAPVAALFPQSPSSPKPVVSKGWETTWKKKKKKKNKSRGGRAPCCSACSSAMSSNAGQPGPHGHGHACGSSDQVSCENQGDEDQYGTGTHRLVPSRPTSITSLLDPAHGPRTHRTWQPIYSRTRRCDFCNNKATNGVVYECVSCSLGTCKDCVDGGRWKDEMRHSINPATLDWTPRSTTAGRRARPRRTGDTASPWTRQALIAPPGPQSRLRHAFPSQEENWLGLSPRSSLPLRLREVPTAGLGSSQESPRASPYFRQNSHGTIELPPLSSIKSIDRLPALTPPPPFSTLPVPSGRRTNISLPPPSSILDGSYQSPNLERWSAAYGPSLSPGPGPVSGLPPSV